MKFNPLNMHLYTDDGTLIKKMHCPYKMQWEDLEESGAPDRKCTRCNHSIVDTALLTDQALLDMMQDNPDTCLKIDLLQSNLKIQYNGTMG
ncbi:MAG: hypothetical protein LW630_07570 [Saprospiraceae bacterium]|jgi:hypothetical protein|nr:hypothetical protein [Saprospiraceae bacterium]